MQNIKFNSLDDLKKDGKSFYWASFFLPSNLRNNVATLYSICRYFDNVADNDDIDRSNQLKQLVNEIKKNKSHKINKFFTEHKIDISIFDDLVSGLILDQSIIRIKNEKELIQYSYKVAGTVGLMMSKVLGIKNPKSNSSAIDLGIAMQMTNIARDIYEDAKMNRIYIPQDWIKNIDIAFLNNEKKTSNEHDLIISNAIHQLLELSEKFYLNGFSGLKFIPLKTRLSIFVAAKVYRGIGIKIKKKKNKYNKQRVYLNIFEKMIITVKSLLIFIFLSTYNYQYTKLRESLPHENL